MRTVRTAAIWRRTTNLMGQGCAAREAPYPPDPLSKGLPLNFADSPVAPSAPDSVSAGYLTEQPPKGPTPDELLFQQLSGLSKSAATATPPVDNRTPPGGQGGGHIGQTSGTGQPAADGNFSPDATYGQAGTRGQTPPASAPPASGSTPAGPGVGGPASPDSVALLARLAPYGITSLDQLKGKSDAELHKIASDVVSHENRDQQLAKYFFKNPDGSYDLSRGPDGQPNGLDAQGRPIPPAGTGATGTTTPPAVPPAGSGSAPKPSSAGKRPPLANPGKTRPSPGVIPLRKAPPIVKPKPTQAPYAGGASHQGG